MEQSSLPPICSMVALSHISSLVNAPKLNVHTLPSSPLVKDMASLLESAKRIGSHAVSLSPQPPSLSSLLSLSPSPFLVSPLPAKPWELSLRTGPDGLLDDTAILSQLSDLSAASRESDKPFACVIQTSFGAGVGGGTRQGSTAEPSTLTQPPLHSVVFLPKGGGAVLLKVDVSQLPLSPSSLECGHFLSVRGLQLGLLSHLSPSFPSSSVPVTLSFRYVVASSQAVVDVQLVAKVDEVRKKEVAKKIEEKKEQIRRAMEASKATGAAARASEQDARLRHPQTSSEPTLDEDHYQTTTFAASSRVPLPFGALRGSSSRRGLIDDVGGDSSPKREKDSGRELKVDEEHGFGRRETEEEEGGGQEEDEESSGRDEAPVFTSSLKSVRDEISALRSSLKGSRVESVVLRSSLQERDESDERRRETRLSSSFLLDDFEADESLNAFAKRAYATARSNALNSLDTALPARSWEAEFNAGNRDDKNRRQNDYDDTSLGSFSAHTDGKAGLVQGDWMTMPARPKTAGARSGAATSSTATTTRGIAADFRLFEDRLWKETTAASATTPPRTAADELRGSARLGERASSMQDDFLDFDMALQRSHDAALLRLQSASLSPSTLPPSVALQSTLLRSPSRSSATSFQDWQEANERERYEPPVMAKAGAAAGRFAGDEAQEARGSRDSAENQLSKSFGQSRLRQSSDSLNPTASSLSSTLLASVPPPLSTQLASSSPSQARASSSPRSVDRSVYTPTTARQLAEYTVARQIVESHDERDVRTPTWERGGEGRLEVGEDEEGNEEEEEEEQQYDENYDEEDAFKDGGKEDDFGWGVYDSLGRAVSAPQNESPDRSNYTPGKGAAMASYKVAREAVETRIREEREEEFTRRFGGGNADDDDDENDDEEEEEENNDEDDERNELSQTANLSLRGVSVSEAEIQALRAEMDALRSQIAGVTTAVKSVSTLISPKKMSPINTRQPSPKAPSPVVNKSPSRSSFSRRMPYSPDTPANLAVAASEEEDVPPPPPTPTYPQARGSHNYDDDDAGGFGSENDDDDFFDETFESTRGWGTKGRERDTRSRTSLDGANSVRDLERWESQRRNSNERRSYEGGGGDDDDELESTFDSMKLTVKNISFPKDLNRSIGAAIGIPGPSSPGRSRPNAVDSRSIEEKVQAVMRAAASSSRSGRGALESSASFERRTLDPAAVVTTSYAAEDTFNDRTGDKASEQERLAKNYRNVIRQQDEQLKAAMQERAMEERRAAFKKVFGNQGFAGLGALPLDLQPPAPPPQLASPKRGTSSFKAPLFEDSDEEDERRDLSRTDPLSVGSRSIASERLLELQSHLPGSTYRQQQRSPEVTSQQQQQKQRQDKQQSQQQQQQQQPQLSLQTQPFKPRIPEAAAPLSPPPTISSSGFNRSGVLVMSPGNVSAAQRHSKFEALRQKKIAEANARITKLQLQQQQQQLQQQQLHQQQQQKQLQLNAQRQQSAHANAPPALLPGGPPPPPHQQQQQQFSWQRYPNLPDPPVAAKLPAQQQAAANPPPPAYQQHYVPPPLPSMASAGKGLQSASNARSIKNALANLCLAGHHMSNDREAALSALDGAVLMNGKKYGEEGTEAPARFIILLSKGSATLAYRGLYMVGSDAEGGGNNMNVAIKKHGWGPKILHSDDEVLGEFFKFNTSKKGFTLVGSRTFGGTIDAVALDPSVLKRRGAS